MPMIRASGKEGISIICFSLRGLNWNRKKKLFVFPSSNSLRHNKIQHFREVFATFLFPSQPKHFSGKCATNFPPRCKEIKRSTTTIWQVRKYANCKFIPPYTFLRRFVITFLSLDTSVHVAPSSPLPSLSLSSPFHKKHCRGRWM